MASDSLLSYADLEAAFQWVCADAPGTSHAFVSRKTGAAHWKSEYMELEEILPVDIDDSSIYVEVPHKNDLDLGMQLVLNFTVAQLHESYADVVANFRKRGAYSRFKDFLERKGALAAWYKYEAQAVERALRDWNEENGPQLKP